MDDGFQHGSANVKKAEAPTQAPSTDKKEASFPNLALLKKGIDHADPQLCIKKETNCWQGK